MEKQKLQTSDIHKMFDRYNFSDKTRNIIEEENLLPLTILQRLQDNFPEDTGFLRTDKVYFNDRNYYSGLKGYRDIIEILMNNGIDIGFHKEREFFIEVYRFLATKHSLNAIDWSNYEEDHMYQLIFPQPGMIKDFEVKKYSDATNDEERAKVVEEYQKKTNPHDGKQKLNKPWYINEDGKLEILQGCQHKYPPVMLIFDKYTQNCFSFCTYCFRHAQVRGDEDMFVQHDVKQVHGYLKQHKEISDILITGGDAGFITEERLAEYLLPILEDSDLSHIRTVRFGSRGLTFHPELMLTEKSEGILKLMKKAVDSGVQIMWVAHMSTPKDILNPGTIAAIRRMRAHGVNIRSQSPIMHHISLWKDKNGQIDIDRSAQNWIKLGNILGMLGVVFHSMYCARPTGEHHYYTVPLVDIHKVFTKVYKGLASVNRPTRYITMTSSEGKISILGTVAVNGETAIALKFNEGRNMDWMDRVYLAKYDEKQNTIEKLLPYQGENHFYFEESAEIENKLEKALLKKLNQYKYHDK